MNNKSVLFEVKDSIAVITLNRPERRNSINQELLSQLYDCMDIVIENNDIKVAVITGNGKSFCSGIDLDCIATDNLFNPRGDGLDMPDIFAKCKKPIIGAINGHAITGGFEIALNCDFLIASETASFADTHSIVGIHPGWGITQLLQDSVGQRMAKQISFTGKFISAEKALKIGLVNEVLPNNNMLLLRAMQIASEICIVKQDMMSVVKGLIEYRNNATFYESMQNEKKGFKKFLKQFAFAG